MPRPQNNREHPDDKRKRTLKAFGLPDANRSTAATVNKVMDSKLTSGEKPLGSEELNAQESRGKRAISR